MSDCHLAIERDSRVNRRQRDAYIDWMHEEAEALGVDRLCLITSASTRGETLEGTRENDHLLVKLVEENPDTFPSRSARKTGPEAKTSSRCLKRAVNRDEMASPTAGLER